MRLINTRRVLKINLYKLTLMKISTRVSTNNFTHTSRGKRLIASKVNIAPIQNICGFESGTTSKAKPSNEVKQSDTKFLVISDPGQHSHPNLDFVKNSFMNKIIHPVTNHPTNVINSIAGFLNGIFKRVPDQNKDNAVELQLVPVNLYHATSLLINQSTMRRFLPIAKISSTVNNFKQDVKKAIGGLMAVFFLLFALVFSQDIFGQTSAVYTTAGANTFVAPVGVTSVTAECWGGGGAGGGATGNPAAGGGGAGGAYAKELLLV